VRHGAWDWNYGGPKKDREFAFNLNRHQFFTHLYQAWRKTGAGRYAETFDQIVRDWVLHTVYPGLEPEGVKTGPGGSAYTWTWRVLEAALRMRTWTTAFYGFQNSDAFTPAARLLMLSSMVDHGRYIRRHHWKRHNHALMEHDGLNRLGLAFPEFKEAEGWHQHAFSEMLKEMDHQVFPDGAHDELSSGYHWVSLSSFENLAEVAMAAGRKVPREYRDRIVEMYDYWAGLVRPDGSLPQNNRADRGIATGRLLAAAERYNRPDWRYIATSGREGTAPDGVPSRFAPWAGHLTCRSGWDADALWSFFNAGPAGNGSVHAQALHFSLSAYGKDFLVASGRFWYMGDKWTKFAQSSRSKNVILIDGQAQELGPRKVDRPLADEHWALKNSFDFARKTHKEFKNLDGEAAHTRIVVFVKDAGCWVVLDRIGTDRPRQITPMWRFRPEREVKIDAAGNLITADPAGANLSIIPVGDIAWEAELVRGREHPSIQGWYSEHTPNWEPNTAAEFKAKIAGDTVFAWLMIPTPEGPAPIPAETKLTVDDTAADIRFIHPDGQEWILRIPLDQGVPTIVRANSEQ